MTTPTPLLLPDLGQLRIGGNFTFMRTDESGAVLKERRKFNPAKKTKFLSVQEANEFCHLLDCALDDVFMSWPGGKKVVVRYVTGEYADHPFSTWSAKEISDLGVWWENIGVDAFPRIVKMWFTTKSKQGKRLANNNATNLLNYPEYCMPMVHEWLQYLRHVNTKPPWTQGRAFLYIVADKVSLSSTTIHEQALLLVKHKYDHGSFGVPGGLEDKGDQLGKLCHQDALLVTAKREFAEEVLNIENGTSVQKEAVADTLSLPGAHFKQLVRGSQHMVAFGVRVDDSFKFEKRVAKYNKNVNPKSSRAEKREVRMSKEMQGYAWVTKSAIENAIRDKTNRLDEYGRLYVEDTTGTLLPVRRYVLGSMEGCEWIPNKWWERIFLKLIKSCG
tara:strand:+ start:8409 stop:9572 length:1164 start_codon:yes stop_codon:yes gene_type:complete